jgi:tRNA-dihydrouridine synthase A
MYRFSVAPMMDWTDRHCRAFHRTLTRHAWLYTEMLTADAVIHGHRARLLGFSAVEHPIALQLGGSDPARLAKAAAIGAAWGYDEINLNVGCPSDRVQEGRFGACLMREPALVGACVGAMRAAVGEAAAVTVKCRIGVDEQDPREALTNLADAAAAAGCGRLIVHARKAWLQGLSPKENREVPPLEYGLVRALKAERPELCILLNGGLRDARHGLAESVGLDGVMLGRAAYQTPRILLEVDPLWAGRPAPASCALEAARSHRAYIAAKHAEGAPLHALVKSMLGLFHGMAGGRLWRRALSEAPRGAGLEAFDRALALVEEVSGRRGAAA